MKRVTLDEKTYKILTKLAKEDGLKIESMAKKLITEKKKSKDRWNNLFAHKSQLTADEAFAILEESKALRK